MSSSRLVASLLTKDQDYQALQAADAAAAATRAGFELEVVYARNNGTLQAEQLYRFIHAREDLRPAAVIVQTVAGDGLPRVAREIARAGIGWVLLNRDAAYIDALRAEFRRVPIAVVTTDQIGIGRIQGRQFLSLLPRGGNALYIQGPPDTSAANDRLQGLREVIANGGINVKIVNGEWTEESSEKAVASWLRLSSTREFHLDLVGAQNDAMAVGARKAIAAARPEWLKVPFTGCDGLPEGGQRLVRQGQLAATVIIPPTAGAAVDLIAAQLRTGTPAPVRSVLASRGFPG